MLPGDIDDELREPTLPFSGVGFFFARITL
jgi:hypothetical protein